MSNRWRGPSSRCTRRTYTGTDGPFRPGRGVRRPRSADHLDLDSEAFARLAHPHLEAADAQPFAAIGPHPSGARSLGRRRRRRRRGPHQAGREAVGQQAGQPSGGRPRGADHHQIEVRHAGLPQTGEEALRWGRAAEDEDRHPAGLPQLGPGGRLREGIRGAPAVLEGGEEGDDQGQQHQHHRAVGPAASPAASPAAMGIALTARAEDSHQPEEDQGRKMGQAQRTGGQAGGPLGHQLDPADEHAGRQVQDVGHRSPSGQPGRHPADEPPGHGGRSRRCGQHVGGHRHHGHPPERRDQERCHRHLRSHGRGQHLGQRRRPGDQAPERRPQPEQAGRRRHREPEAEAAHQERVGQQQSGDGEGQHPGARGGTGRHRRGGRHTGHGPGPKHRRLEPGDRPEGDQDGQGGDPATPDPEPTQQGAEHGQHEGHVLPRHDQQVGEARSPEGVGHLGRLLAVVAEHEPGEEGPGGDRQAVGTPEEEITEAVDGAGEGRSPIGGHHLLHAQPADDVTDLEPGSIVGRGCQPTDDVGPLPRRQLVEQAGRRPPGPQLEAAGASPHLDPYRTAAPLRVGHEGDRTVPRPPGHRLHPLPRPVAEAGGQQRHSDDQPLRAPPHPRRHDRGHSDRPRHGQCRLGSETGGHGQGHGLTGPQRPAGPVGRPLAPDRTPRCAPQRILHLAPRLGRAAS